jgi:hypothetical protein
LVYVHDFLFRKLYHDSTLTSLHKVYKNCINNEVLKHFNDGTVPQEELCLKEKKEYYNHIHQSKKLEHDLIMKYYKDLLMTLQIEGI